MRISLRRIKEINNFTGFREDLIEKVIRLEELLQEIFRHPYLTKRLLLKGGTGLIFCYLSRPRLSVDIDLNYIGSIDMEIMRQERPKLEEAIIRIVKDKGYEILRCPSDEHAGGKWRLGYKDLWGGNKNLELDINYLYRVPIGSPQKELFQAFPDSEAFQIALVSKEELFAGKVVAALERVSAKDVYDIYNITTYRGRYDRAFFRKTVILLGASKREDFRKVTPDRFQEISEREIENVLYPLLPKHKRPTRKEILKIALPFIKEILRFTSREKEFLDRFLDSAEYRPDILFSKYPDLIPELERHPALLWKRLNVERYLKGE